MGTVAGMRVHLVDGTYELFRQHFGAWQATRHADPGPYAATIGVLGSTLALVEDGATHIGVASDHIIESFRNDLWPGYKTSEGMPPELLHQIPVLEDALVAMGVDTWAMVEYEADDALGAAAAIADADERVEQVLIVTPDKDLCQCVRGDPGRAVRPSQARDHRRGRGDREVRRRAGVDPRLPRPRRRHGRRVPRPARLGRQERGRRARPVRPPRGHPAVGRRLGRARRCAAPCSWRPRCGEQIELALLFRRIATVETRRRGRHGRRLVLDRPDTDGSPTSPARSARPSWPGRADRAAVPTPRVPVPAG